MFVYELSGSGFESSPYSLVKIGQNLDMSLVVRIFIGVFDTRCYTIYVSQIPRVEC